MRRLSYLIPCAMLLATCGRAQEIPGQSEAQDRPPAIGKVFFAQQHVQEPSDPLFKLVGNRAALIKVQVCSDVPSASPDVVAMLESGTQSLEFTLRGPEQLPKPYTGELALMVQSYDDSFTGMIPGEWIKPGLKVTVELRTYSYPSRQNAPGQTGMTILDRKVIDGIKVGAANKILLTMFDIHFFEEEKDLDFPAGWEIALADRLPVAEFKVQRVRPIVFEELVMQPMGQAPAMRCRSMEEWEKRAGQRFEGESATASPWMRALKRAGGRLYDHGVVFLNLAFVPANGWGEASTLAGTTDLGRMGNLAHEFGHVFSLPHWSGSKAYPYKGDLYGISAPAPNFPHVGPTWAFSLHRQAFISPIVQAENSVGGKVGTWKKDPMEGGAFGDQEIDHMIRHFSDYSVNQMQNFLERRMLFWDESLRGYYRWNEETLSFSTRVQSDGWNLATNPFNDVISVMVSASAVTPEANFIYPPIGPYKAGLLKLFDANSAEDRELATQFGFSDETCDLCVRVTRGGSTNVYLLEAKLNPAADPLTQGSFVTTAINLPAGGGELTEVELLHTPNVVSKGMPPNPGILHGWKAKSK